jgi:flagellum-specific peptidoglycan hydrolase FlgJ
MDKKIVDFVKEYFPRVKPICAKNGVSAVGCLAQCAQETGWGEHHKDNIWFGIKPWKKKQKAKKHKTTEDYDGDGVNEPVVESFVEWDSFEGAVQGYCNFLKENPNYKECFQYVNDWRKFVAVIARHYATDKKYYEYLMWDGKMIERVIYSEGLI